MGNTFTCPDKSTWDISAKACVCPYDMRFNANWSKCVPLNCPGQETIVSANTCGCANGRIPATNHKCDCPVSQVFSAVSNRCECPSGYTLSSPSSTTCVKTCFWKANNQGFSCLWKDHAKTALKLWTDCEVTAPVAKDNYVADQRTNKLDDTNPSDNPRITVTATKQGTPTETQTKATTWLNYVLAPGTFEDQVQLGSFGVFDLSMVATDYRYQATCPGCVAVVDNYPPTPKDVCTTTDTRTTSPDFFSPATLASIVSAEAAFTGFYSPANVKNNGAETPAGDNKRCDDESMVVTDFFKPAPAPACSSVDESCFTTNFVSDLLTSATAATLPPLATIVQGASTASLVCKRCCFKSIVLQEHYAKYACGVATPAWDKHGSSNCKFGRCLTMKSTDLVSASAATTIESDLKTSKTLAALPAGSETRTGASFIHRSVTCTKWTENCKVQPKLSDLLTKQASWVASAGVPASFNVNDFVFWRYKVGSGGAWTPWNGNDELTFSDESTDLTVQVWTRCGKVIEVTFVVVLHLHTDRAVCKDFVGRFVDTSPTPRKVDDNICAYPRSDFALLTFHYDSSEDVPHDARKVRGKYTGISCDVTLAEQDAVATTTTLALPLPATPDASGVIQFAKQFALELVKDPTTAKNTDVHFKCLITFEYFDSSKADTDTCEASFRLTDCNGPKLQTAGNNMVCQPDKCSTPGGLPGPMETCGGDVFTTVKTGATVATTKKGVVGTCCSECSQTLSCNALPEASTLKRCEPPVGSDVLLALAVDETAAHAVAEVKASPSSSSMVTMLLGASAMVAVVALVVAKSGSRAKKQPPVVVDDVYMSLMD